MGVLLKLSFLFACFRLSGLIFVFAYILIAVFTGVFQFLFLEPCGLFDVNISEVFVFRKSERYLHQTNSMLLKTKIETYL
jgi:hypothetical protein